ncbi:MAG TPA: ATP-binding protein [Mycobacteriales bacterium]|jgi:anti-sigma regulatory factor (Ser/Thr protein kinase)|nr:ATP-binding protein [Mycobacteriales bacterium]
MTELASTASRPPPGLTSIDVTDTAASCRPLQLPPEASSAGEARHYVRDCLGALGRPELIECAVLGVDELVANVCQHAGTPLVVDIGLAHDGRVRIEVTDLSPTAPVRRTASDEAIGGRGLTLLDACGRWGLAPTTTSGSGKTIWFEPFSSLAQSTSALA